MNYPLQFKKQIKTHLSVYLWVNVGFHGDINNNITKLSFKIQVENLGTDSKILTFVKNGWNSIDITDLFNPKILINDKIFDTLAINCIDNCSLELKHYKNYSFNKTGTSFLCLNINDNQKPLLQLKSFDRKRLKRSKIVSKTEIKNLSLIHECSTKQFNSTKCCLISYIIDFASLKLSPWIIHPSVFSANYCFGSCLSPTGNYSWLF